MRSKTACFTGHRKLPIASIDMIRQKLRRAVLDAIERGYCYFGAGGALGFDTIAAQTVLDLKQTNPQIRLILVLPCRTQADRWNEQDRAIYEQIKAQADKVVYTSQAYTKDCMFKRNRHLVDGSSLCICYLSEASGGTAYTVEYAEKQGLRIVNVANTP